MNEWRRREKTLGYNFTVLNKQQKKKTENKAEKKTEKTVVRGQEKKGQETREATLEAVYISCEYLLFANTCFQPSLQTKEKTREG